MSDTGSTSPAGWYNDPAGSGHLRWWDGTAWTSHFAPQPTPAPTPTPIVPTPVVHTPVVEAPAGPSPTVAAPEQEPYVPFRGSWNRHAQAASDDFARPAQWNTAGAWLLAFSGVLSAIAFGLLVMVSGTSIRSYYALGYDLGYNLGRTLGAYAVVYLVIVLFALADQRKLKSFGYVTLPSLWWMLLAPPLAYLIARTVVVWGEVRKGIAPLITYFVVNVLSGILVGVALAILIPGAVGANSSTAFTSSLQTGLDQKGGHYTVTCPPSLPTTIGAHFTCTALDEAGTSHALDITIVRGADGKPTAQLLSVTPPITG